MSNTTSLARHDATIRLSIVGRITCVVLSSSKAWRVLLLRLGVPVYFNSLLSPNRDPLGRDMCCRVEWSAAAPKLLDSCRVIKPLTERVKRSSLETVGVTGFEGPFRGPCILPALCGTRVLSGLLRQFNPHTSVHELADRRTLRLPPLNASLSLVGYINLRTHIVSYPPTPGEGGRLFNKD